MVALLIQTITVLVGQLKNRSRGEHKAVGEKVQEKIQK